MNVASYAERNNIEYRLAQLELEQAAAHIASELSGVQKTLSDTAARFENILIERIFIARMKMIFRKMQSPDAGDSLAEAFRKRQEEGKLAGLSMAAADDGHIDQIDVTTASPAASLNSTPAKPSLLYAACGGFILPPSPKQKATAERLATACGCNLVLANHRYAPEHPFPAAPTDVAEQYKALIANGTPPEHIVIGGDTSGAAIVLSALLLLREEGAPMPAGILLFSPWADLSLSGWSYITQSVSSTSPYRMEIAAFCARLYLQDKLATDPLASPAFANFKDLPPMSVHASRYDIRFDDALKIIENAKQANIPCRINYWDSPRHHLERFNSKDAKKSFELAAAFVSDTVRDIAHTD